MKQLLFITLSLLILFSCNKKEKLKDDYSILIGEWRQTKLTDHSSSGCSIEYFESSNPPKITFKKNGKVFVNKFATEEKFLIRFKDESYFETKKEIFDCNAILDSIKNYFLFEPQLSQRLSNKKYLPIFYVNENKLIISSNGKKLFSKDCEVCLSRYYHHIFEKVN